MSNPLQASPLRKKLDPELAKNLSELIQRIRVPGLSWDAVAFTDGSAMTDQTPGGYATAMLLRRQAGLITMAGSCTSCTSQEAEVRAVAELANYLMREKMGHRKGGFIVLLVTDSSYVDTTLKEINKDPVHLLNIKSHHAWWSSIQFASQVGIRISPTHIHRNNNPLMSLVDNLSRDFRLAVDAEALSARKKASLTLCKQSFSLTRPAGTKTATQSARVLREPDGSQ